MGTLYRHPALRQLKEQQVRHATAEHRLAQMDRAERLLREIDPVRGYPLEFLCYRITGYRPDSTSLVVLPGEDLRQDLRQYVEDLAATVRQPVEQANERVLTVEEVGRLYNVSTRTVNRWRRQGLVARRFLMDGKTKVGFLESSVARFVADHREQVERGTRFRHVTDVEREEIIRRARRMASISGRGRLAEIARRIARKMERSPETIRMTLKTYDRDHPDRPIFPPSTAPLDEEAKAKIHRLHRMGVSAESLASQFGRTRQSIYRVINEMRAQRLLEQKLEFMPHPSFDDARPPRRDPRTLARTRRRQGPTQVQTPQGPAALPRQPLRSPLALPRARGTPLPQDELPQVPGRQDPRQDRPGQGQGLRPR